MEPTPAGKAAIVSGLGIVACFVGAFAVALVGWAVLDRLLHPLR